MEGQQNTTLSTPLPLPYDLLLGEPSTALTTFEFQVHWRDRRVLRGFVLALFHTQRRLDVSGSIHVRSSLRFKLTIISLIAGILHDQRLF